MKDDPKLNYSWNEQRGLFKANHTTKFFRKGKVGDWQQYYTEAMIKEVDSISANAIKSAGLDFNDKLTE